MKKRTPVFYIKTLLVSLGAIILFLSGFLQFLLKTRYELDMQQKIVQYPQKIAGFDSPLWYAILSGTLLIFAVGYFFNKTVNVVLVFVLIPLFALAVPFMTIIFTFDINIDFPSYSTEIKEGYVAEICGAILIAVATCISVLKKKQPTTDHVDLLDS